MLSLEDNETVWHKRVWWRKFVWWNSKTFTDFLGFCTVNIKLLSVCCPETVLYSFTCSVMKWTCVVICFLQEKGGTNTYHLSLHPIFGLLCVAFMCWRHQVMLLLLLHIAPCLWHLGNCLCQFFLMFYTVGVSSFSVILYYRIGRIWKLFLFCHSFFSLCKNYA